MHRARSLVTEFRALFTVFAVCGWAAGPAHAADPLLEINQRLANIAKLYRGLQQPSAHHVEANSGIVAEMQTEADAADRVARWELTPAGASAALNDLRSAEHT